MTNDGASVMPEIPLNAAILSAMNEEMESVRITAANVAKKLQMRPLMAGAAEAMSVLRTDDERIQDADVCIFLIGSQFTDETDHEYRNANRLGKPSIVFILDIERDPAHQDSVASILSPTAVCCEHLEAWGALPERLERALWNFLSQTVRRHQKLSDGLYQLAQRSLFRTRSASAREARKGSDWAFQPR